MGIPGWYPKEAGEPPQVPGLRGPLPSEAAHWIKRMKHPKVDAGPDGIARGPADSVGGHGPRGPAPAAALSSGAAMATAPPQAGAPPATPPERDTAAPDD